MTEPSQPWDECYQTGNTPWEKGEPAPVLPVLVQKLPDRFRDRRILVPGCGIGHDARFLASHGAEVVAVDIAPTALARARERDPDRRVTWIEADLFVPPVEFLGTFDMVWEHTCLCALDPDTREAYAQALKSVLKPQGCVCGVFFINPDMNPGENGPPFGISVEELTALWQDAGFDILEQWVPDVAYEGRAGRERFMWLRLL